MVEVSDCQTTSGLTIPSLYDMQRFRQTGNATDRPRAGYMLFKVSNNLVQIYRSFSITGNYGRRSFSKYGISDYKLM
jgi:hypothetical protein